MFVLRNKKGFSLVELLTIIAILAILTRIILPTILTTRDRARDKSIISNLVNMRARAAIIYGNTGTYANVCTAGTNPKIMFDQASALNSTGANECRASATAWGANVQFKTKANTWYCVDSAGFSGEAGSDTIATNDYSCL